jgi:hypothetical protein
MLVGALIGCGASRAADGPAAGSASPAQPATPGQGTGGTPGAAAPPSDSVHIVLTVIPATAKAKVLWGKKLLGVVEKRKPLVIVRPRDSGPIDVVVRADGFLPVQTRLYTFADGKLGVKLTPPEEQKTLLGYREPPPPEPAPGAADGGAGAPIAPAAPNEADAGAPP